MFSLKYRMFTCANVSIYKRVNLLFHFTVIQIKYLLKILEKSVLYVLAL